MSRPTSDNVEFFVSYTGKDKAWAEWIAWQLEDHGYRTLIQAWDFKSGGVFPADMHRALQRSARVLAILTPDYMQSDFCQPEWVAAIADDPTGEKGTLLCVRVADFMPDGLLRGRTYIDLVGLPESDALELLLDRVERGRAKPEVPPTFPGTSTGSPPFPGPTLPVSNATLTTTIRHNLPAIQPFFGREEELKKIADALDPESRTWGVLIDGAGGMGKTSLAVRAAYGASPQLFDKIVFVSLKSRELDDGGIRYLGYFVLTGLQELFNELADELGCDQIVNAVEDVRPKLLLNALRGTQTLLILDNLESLVKIDRDTVFTFVKKLPAGCKAILTSRGRIGSGAEELILDKLSPNAAMATLKELALHNPHLKGTTKAERLDLYQQTAGNPLLLRWTAGQIGRGHCLTICDAINFLRSCPHDNDPLEFIFGDLVDDLSQDELKVICALTYFTLPTTVAHISEVTGLSKSSADLALRSLTVRSLAVPSDEMRTFALLPMVADFLRRKRPQGVLEGGNRIEQWAYATIIENGGSNYDRFPILEDAWDAIVPAISQFFLASNAKLQTVCNALTDFLNFSGRLDDWLRINQVGEACAVAAGDFRNAGWRAYHSGYIHDARREADLVLACADRAITHWRLAFPQTNSHWPKCLNIPTGTKEFALATSLRGQGRALKRDFSTAIDDFLEAVRLLRSLTPAPLELGVCLNSLAGARMSIHDFARAEIDLNEAIQIATVLGHRNGIVNFTGNLAEVAIRRGNWSQAELLARKSLPLSEELGRQELIGLDCRRIAISLVRQGKKSAAMPYARRSVEILKRIGSLDLPAAESVLGECECRDS